MLASYRDILDLIDREPIWWDSNGVPRFSDLDPDDCPNIYADKICFMKVACQSCGQEFIVEMHTSTRQDRLRKYHNVPLWDPTKLEYGDPPSHGCVGDTMSSCPREVVVVYDRGTGHKWQKTHENIAVRAPWDQPDADWW